MPNGITIDSSQFTSAINEYRQYTKRDIPTIINTKGFYIARGAVRNTVKVPLEKIKDELMASAKDFPKAPLAAIIVNKRLGPGKGLYGARMAIAVKELIKRRKQSRANFAAGFIPAVKAFEPLAEKKGRAPRSDSTVKQIGPPRGAGQPARNDAWVARGIIENFATSATDKTGALERYAGAGLQQAFDDEAASMNEYIARKMQETADKFGSK